MELGKRTLTAFVLLAGVFAVIQYAPDIVFFLLLQVFVLGALWEFYSLAARKKLRPQRALGVVLAAAFAAFFIIDGLSFEAVLFAGLLLTCFYYVIHITTLEKLATFTTSPQRTLYGALS